MVVLSGTRPAQHHVGMVGPIFSYPEHPMGGDSLEGLDSGAGRTIELRTTYTSL